MMKIFSLILGFLFLTAVAGHAQATKRLSSQELYDYSLMSLKESAQEVAQKNKILAKGNQELAEKVKAMRIEYQNSVQEKEQLKQKYRLGPDVQASFERKMLEMEGNISSAADELTALSQEQAALERKVAIQNKKKDEVQRQISDYEMEVVELNNKLKMLQAKLDQQDFSNDKKLYAENIESGRKTVNQLQSRLDKLRGVSGRPNSQLSSLSEQNSELKSRLDELQHDQVLLSEKSAELASDVKIIEEQHQAQLSQINETMAKLQPRFEELSALYAQANAKLKDKNPEEAINTKEEEQLLQNLSVIKEQYTTLQQELASLQQKTAP